MWRWLAGFSTGAVLGIALGVVIGFFLFPYFFQAPPGTDQLSEAERDTLVAKGSFIHVNPSDPIHYGKGDVSVYPGLVFLHENFEVGPGPAFHVYLVPKASVRSAEDVTNAMFVDLGPLRAFKGSQRYAVPAGVDLAKFPSVVIWCRQFSVLISPADLDFAKPR